MTWWKTGERREIVDYPDGRDWRCLGPIGKPGAAGCGFSKPEDAPGGDGCPECGGPLSRIAVRL